MNKLYIIRWLLPNGHVISVSSFWDESALRKKIRANPQWTFTKIEDSKIHAVYVAR